MTLGCLDSLKAILEAIDKLIGKFSRRNEHFKIIAYKYLLCFTKHNVNTK